MAPDPRQPLPRLGPKQLGPVGAGGAGEFAEGFAILDDYLSKRFGDKMPKAGYFGKAWGIYELVAFLRSGGRENRGDAAALLAEFVVSRAKKKIAEGVVLTGARYAGYLVAEAFIVAWTTYEAFKLGVYLREVWDEDERREAVYQKWQVNVHQHFWSLEDFTTSMQGFRESAFDQIAGDVASHAAVPSLTVAASKELQQLKNDISRRWLDRLQQLREAESPRTVTTASGLTITVPPEKFETAKAARALEVEFANGIKAVIEYQSNPAHWNLTKEQQAALPESWQRMFAERDALQAWTQSHSMPYPDPTSPGHMIRTYEERDDALRRLTEHMGAEAENPAVPADQVLKDHAPVHGPQPRPRS